MRSKAIQSDYVIPHYQDNKLKTDIVNTLEKSTDRLGLFD